MFSLANFISIAGLAAVAAAAAAPAAAGTNVAITVTICTDQDLRGNCMRPTINTQQQCLGYSKTEWDNNMRSVYVPDHFRCRFWDSNNCNGDSTPDLYGPGSSNIPGGMRNKATSFKCYQN